ncbi:MAG TPA: protein translocase subunit SecD [Actinomycetota bacterium]|nr:protein translocase subunit SecD [Actinomycetota bacterium]
MAGRARLILSVAFVLALVGGAVVGFATGLRPLLGLDLEGGVSVTLAAPPGTERGVMVEALDRIRDRVDALGVAEPDIALLGDNLIQVELPGLGGQGQVVVRGGRFCVLSATGKDLGCFDRRAQAEARARAQSVQRVLEIIGTTARLEEREVKETIPEGDERYLKFTQGVIRPDDPVRSEPTFEEVPAKPDELLTFEDLDGDGFFDQGREPKYLLGPVEITGADLKSAEAVFVPAGPRVGPGESGWQVEFTLNPEGARKFAEATRRLVGRQLAIVLDGVVQSAPTVQDEITGGRGVITGSFTKEEAENLEVVLDSGALPVELERQEVRTVSPLLGRESLHQGLVAGVAGLVALMAYLAFYYRLLGVVTWLGMGIWATLALALVALLGRTIGYALTLAGVAGIVVSLGITADSYIVFYERLKDEVRQGKSLRASVAPAFRRAWRTIVAGDVVTALAAAVLYVLSVGSVRGFALTLGLSTALDLFVVYFFKRPTVFLVARNQALANLPGLGLRSGVAAEPLPAGAGGGR